ncbi:methyl-accepting chemotaxis protein [Undibacterium luofuense]|uniref:Cache domain-containing protein n=1 Tax=Undibacterium luofuense TaxID=2828733 RepID=A0A941I4Y4_9BURK|nr:methyl-accepting chemotaxis protein [Undibacterium luofuense]MBR7782202.1 cache domain-containing protein [Undibacterium luofuense]
MSAVLKILVQPTNHLLEKLSLRSKLLGIFFILLVPLIILTITLFEKDQNELNTSISEAQGSVLNHRLMNLIVTVQQHRGQMNLSYAGESVTDKLNKLRQQLKDDNAKLDEHEASFKEWKLLSQWSELRNEVNALADGKTADNAATSLAQHTALITRLLGLNYRIAESSGLLLDPTANSYFLMDLSILKLPLWIEEAALIRGKGAGLIRSGQASLMEKAGVLAQVQSIDKLLTQVTLTEDSLQRAGETLPDEQKAARSETAQFLSMARTAFTSEQPTGDATSFFDAGTKAIAAVRQLQLSYQAKLEEILEKRVSEQRTERNWVMLIIIFSLVIAGYLIVAVYLNILRTTRVLQRSVASAATGDLTRLVEIRGVDEVATTAQEFEKMTLSLSALVANVRTNANVVHQLGNDLSGGIQDLSERTEQQASSLEQTSASIQDLADTVKNNARSATAVDQLATQVRQIAESGSSTMVSAVQSMQGIQTSAGKVRDIIGIIDGIAFQTNILALNAAVEAARAGEQGRGFAVVASEVRSLAQRSAQSSREIRQLIDTSVEQVDQGVQEIHHVNQTLEDIVKGIRELASNINAISTASISQSDSLQQINEALHHLDEITQRNAALSERAKQVAGQMEERSQQLTSSVSGFRLRQGTADEALAMVKKAVALYRQNPSQALSLITSNHQQAFADRDMYVFAFNRQGQYLAFGGNPSKLRVSLMSLPGLNGKKLVHDAFALPASGGWVDYQITNPANGKVDWKTSYIEAITDDVVLGCGVYKLT